VGEDQGAMDRAGPVSMARRQGRRMRRRCVEEEAVVGDGCGGGGSSGEEQGRADGDGRATVGRVGAASGMRC
jgi:hypothetical protein